MNQPPTMAPKKPVSTKPRSQTHITNFPSDGSSPKQLSSNGIPSTLMETRSASVGNGLDVQRTKPLPGKPRGQPPPKPRPLNQPLTGSKKQEQSGSVSPPPPPPRKESNNPVAANGAPKGGIPINEYSLLEYASVAPVGGVNRTSHTPLVI